MAGGGKGSATYKKASKTRSKHEARGEDAAYFRMQARAERSMKHAERKGGMGATSKGQVAAAAKGLQRDAGTGKGSLRAAAPKSDNYAPKLSSKAERAMRATHASAVAAGNHRAAGEAARALHFHHAEKMHEDSHKGSDYHDRQQIKWHGEMKKHGVDYAHREAK